MTEFERSTFEGTRLVAQPVGVADDARRAIERCHVLLSDRGDVSSERLANDALTAYESLAGASLDAFFTFLTKQFAPDAESLDRSLDAVRRHPSPEALGALQLAMEPRRRELFRRLNLARGGTAALIEMRRRVLCGLASHPEWSAISADLEHLLRSWLNVGFLELRRIDWRTPTPVLENLIKYEAVHHIRDWADLRRRLQDDRRCFGFFHPSLPHEPLIFTELALTAELSARVQPLLDPESPVLDRKAAKLRHVLFDLELPRRPPRRLVRQLADPACRGHFAARVPAGPHVRDAVADSGLPRLAGPRSQKRQQRSCRGIGRRSPARAVLPMWNAPTNWAE